MSVLDTAAALVARHEGFSARPYRCPAGIPTIGHGTTRYPGGQAVALTDPACTEGQAREWLAYDLRGAEQAVDALVTVPLNANQHAALCSFVYNVGRKAFSASTLLLKLNRGDVVGAAGEFGRWTKGGGKLLPGLVKRRAEEAALFLKA